MKAILRQVRISSKKANLIAALVRRKNVQEALDILTYTQKKGAKILRKVIYSAAKNAENNNKQDFATLKIKEIIVTEGATYKRSLPVSKGRSNPILKRTAHITVKVEAGEAKAEAKESTTPKKRVSKKSVKT